MRIVRIIVLVIGFLSGEVGRATHHELAPILDQSVILPDTHEGSDEQAWNVSHAREPANVPDARDTHEVWADYGIPDESTTSVV
jgi:hypothetical protein